MMLVVGGLILLAVSLWAKTQRAPISGPIAHPEPHALALVQQDCIPAFSDGVWCLVDTPVWKPDRRGEHLWRGAMGTFQADGECLRWFGLREWVWLPWDGVLAVHVRPGNLVLIHGVGIDPFAVRLPDPVLFQAQVQTWLQNDWTLNWVNEQWVWIAQQGGQ